MTATTLDEPRLKVDHQSRPDFKVGDTVALTRDWDCHKRGTHFTAVKLVECSTGDYLRFNARVVYENEPAADPFFWRNLPAEYLARVPAVGETFVLNVNQGDRTARVLAVIGDEMLYDYEMPRGRVYMHIARLHGASPRPVSERALPKKWRAALDS